MAAFPDKLIVRIYVDSPIKRQVGLVRWHIGRALLRAAAAMLAAPIEFRMVLRPGGGAA